MQDSEKMGAVADCRESMLGLFVVSAGNTEQNLHDSLEVATGHQKCVVGSTSRRNPSACESLSSLADTLLPCCCRVVSDLAPGLGCAILYPHSFRKNQTRGNYHSYSKFGSYI
jgi:hypothetical protein